MKVTTLKGIFPDPKPVRRKNFIQENMKSLRRMEQCFQTNKEIEELQKLQLHQHHKITDKYQNVSARVVTSFREKKKQYENHHADLVSKNNVHSKTNHSASTDKVKDNVQIENRNNALELDKKQAVPKKTIRQGINNNISDRQKKTSKHNKSQQKPLSKISSEPDVRTKADNDMNSQSTVKYRSQGIQTLDTDQVESIYSEGVIRYPSKKVTKHDETANNGDLNQQKERSVRNQFDSPTDRGDMCNVEDAQNVDLRNSVSPVPREEIDFIKLNKERTSIATKLAIQLNNGVPPSNYRMGVVPKYDIISSRKKGSARKGAKSQGGSNAF
ncbi:uncharacterized protein LOC114944094 isoform X2 [Nylanderia fulva]|uniref:uncharacterized protein LOC114944094 isoform X2 n=1 Tax=Nylanderia fulva TaxID=613905 RepID=UPI0010FB74EC|nr:uncharacterized protein LOC114944094 isoform X2 [Nylanderia fulva]